MDFDYEMIAWCDDPRDIEDVSMMRHYVNCHGITGKLQNFMNCSFEEISDIYDYVRGYENIESMKNKLYREKCISEGKERDDRINEARMKNEELVSNFKYHQQEGLCGNIGTRRVKLFLNTKIKEGDKVANAYRLALEAEHKNIDAKNSYGKYKDKIYEQKRVVIDELISLCLENDFVCGYQVSNVRDTDFIIYFELPDMRQISFHSDIPNELFGKMKKYEKEWDGEVNSTIAKIECAIEKRYHDELVQYNEKVEIGAKKREEAKRKKAEIARQKAIAEKIEYDKKNGTDEYRNVSGNYKNAFKKYEKIVSKSLDKWDEDDKSVALDYYSVLNRMKKVIEKQYPEFVVPEEIKESVEKYTEKLIDKDFVCKVPTKPIKEMLKRIDGYVDKILMYKDSIKEIECKNKNDRSDDEKHILSEYNNAKGQIRCCIVNCGKWFRYEDYSTDDFDLKECLRRKIEISFPNEAKIRRCKSIKKLSEKIKNISNASNNFMSVYNNLKNKDIDTLSDYEFKRLKSYEEVIYRLNVYKERYNELVSDVENKN